MITELFYYDLTSEVALMFQADVSDHDDTPPYIMKMLKPLPGSLRMSISGRNFMAVGNGVIAAPEYPRIRCIKVIESTEVFSNYLKCNAV